MCLCWLIVVFNEKVLTLSVAGNWDPKTQDARYSCKLPLKAIRALAGFDQEDIHFNPRVACEPRKELSDMIFPWIEGEIETVFQKNNMDDNNRITVVNVLRFWASLQDVAAMSASIQSV